MTAQKWAVTQVMIFKIANGLYFFPVPALLVSFL